jgi:hypothetical protein
MNGLSINFINSFYEYKKQNNTTNLSFVFHGINGSKELIKVKDISTKYFHDNQSYYQIERLGGINFPLKIYNREELASTDDVNAFNSYNFSKYFSSAQSVGLLEKKGNNISIEENFFISIDDSHANELLFGSQSKIGYLLDIDTSVAETQKSSYSRTFNINSRMSKMFINVDFMTQSQQERRIFRNDIGYYVINSEGTYNSSLGVKGIKLLISRRDEIPYDTKVIS